jgi:hypothetical protein
MFFQPTYPIFFALKLLFFWALWRRTREDLG